MITKTGNKAQVHLNIESILNRDGKHCYKCHWQCKDKVTNKNWKVWGVAGEALMFILQSRESVILSKTDTYKEITSPISKHAYSLFLPVK